MQEQRLAAPTRTEQVVTPGLYRLYVDGKPTDHYRIQRTRGGVAVRQRFQAKSVTAAKAFLTKVDGKIIADGPEAFGDRSVTVGALVESFLTFSEGPHGQLSKNTIAHRRQLLRTHVVPGLGEKTRAVDVSPLHIRKLARDLTSKGLAGASVRSCITSASAVFAYGVRVTGSVARNPVRDLERGDLPSGKRTSEPRYLSTDEVSLLLKALSPEFRPIAAACYFAALRVSEALALRWEDVDTDAKLIHVRAGKTAASVASVPLLAPLAEELAAHRKRQGVLGFERIKPESLVFQTVTGLSPGRRNVHRAVANAALRVKLKVKADPKRNIEDDGQEPVGVHDLRHSAAAMAFGHGLNAVEVSKFLRHANPAITLSTYSALTSDQARAIGDKLAGVGGAS